MLNPTPQLLAKNLHDALALDLPVPARQHVGLSNRSLTTPLRDEAKDVLHVPSKTLVFTHASNREIEADPGVTRHSTYETVLIETVVVRSFHLPSLLIKSEKGRSLYALSNIYNYIIFLMLCQPFQKIIMIQILDEIFRTSS